MAKFVEVDVRGLSCPDTMFTFGYGDGIVIFKGARAVS